MTKYLFQNFFPYAFAGALLIGVLGGCSLKISPNHLASGTYRLKKIRNSADGDKTAADVSLEVDRKRLSLTLSGDVRVTRTLEATPPGTWPRGCRTTFDLISEETFALGDELEVGSVILKKPVVVARCPSDQYVRITESDDRSCMKKVCLIFDKKRR